MENTIARHNQPNSFSISNFSWVLVTGRIGTERDSISDGIMLGYWPGTEYPN
jgi:hypothetical protein